MTNVYKIDTQLELVIDHLKTNRYQEIPNERRGYRLFVAAIDTTPKWASFLNGITKEQLEFKNVSASFVLIRVVGPAEAYAVTGGFGTYAIQPFIDRDFGLDVLSRLINPDKIKSLRQQAISGNVIQEELVYKRTYTYHTDPLSWLKLPRQILGEVEKDDFSTELGLERNDRRPIRLESRRGFSIRRSLSIDELDTLLDHLQRIKSRPRRLELLKGCEEVSPGLRKELEDVLTEHVSSLYERYLEDPDNFEDNSVFLASDDAHQWLLCTRFTISLGSRTHVSEQLELTDLLNAFREWEMSSLPDLSKIEVHGYDEDGRQQIHGRLTEFIMAEIPHRNQPHIFMDRRWFRVRYSFSEHLDEIIRPFLAAESDYSLHPWPASEKGPITEDRYIEEILKQDTRLVVFHKNPVYTRSGRAEMCDIYDMRNERPCLVFIKRGITSKSRELSRQAVDSVLLLLSDPEFQNEAVEKLRAQGIEVTDRFAFNECGVVLAVVDEKDGPTNPLLERMRIISKIEFAFALQTLKSRTGGLVYLYEIPKERI